MCMFLINTSYVLMHDVMTHVPMSNESKPSSLKIYVNYEVVWSGERVTPEHTWASDADVCH